MAEEALQFRSWGFELYTPPTPFPGPDAGARSRFVMLDDINDKFYDIDYETPLLGNSTPWSQLALHTVQDPAIVFPPEQQDMLYKMSFGTGLLVSIESRTPSVIVARKLGRVNVKPIPHEYMNWAGLAGKKRQEIVDEMRAGLLRHVWDRRAGAVKEITYVTPGPVLDALPRPWHRDGTVLSFELDDIFIAGKMIGPPSTWRISGLESSEVERSRTRAALFIDN